MLAVLNTKGILCFLAAFARISGELGQINPYNPIGAIPKGAS